MLTKDIGRFRGNSRTEKQDNVSNLETRPERRFSEVCKPIGASFKQRLAFAGGEDGFEIGWLVFFGDDGNFDLF